MSATVLNRAIGQDKASKIVKKAHSENLSLKEAALSLKMLTSDEFDHITDARNMS